MIMKKLRIFNRISLKNRIFLSSALVTIISLLILAFFANRTSSQVIIEKAEKSSYRELVLIDRNLDTIINCSEDYTRVIASDFRLQAQLLSIRQNPSSLEESLQGLEIKNAMSEIMSNIVAPNTQLASASVYVGKDVVYSGSDIDNTELNKYINGEFINRAYQVQVPVWKGPFKLTFNDGRKEDVFAVGKLVIDRNIGYKTGVVVLFISEKRISKIYTDNKSNKEDRYFILDSNNSIISAQDKSALYQNAGTTLGLNGEQLKELQKNEKLIVRKEGRQQLFTMQNFGRLGWKVVSVVFLDEIIKENIQIQRILVIVGVLCLIFAFVASFFISYTVTKPVNRLTKVMRKIVKGEMGIRAETESMEEMNLLAGGFNNLMDKIEELMSDIYTEQKSRREFEFQLIQSQIKPHFLYNTLETIISLNKLGRYEDAIVTTKYLANFYRYCLSKGNDIIKIQDEIQLIRTYLFIQNMRYSNYMEFVINADEQIADYTIPKLTLQPLVENSIYHGLKPRNGKGKLEIRGYEKEGNIYIEIIDDGIGIPADKMKSLLEYKKEKKEDFGLGSVDRRLKLLYGNQYGLSLQSEIGRYTKVIVIIPATK